MYCDWQVDVGHPSEVDEIFDAISYSKGASVIRMLHNYIGDEVRGHMSLRVQEDVQVCITLDLLKKSVVVGLRRVSILTL